MKKSCTGSVLLLLTIMSAAASASYGAESTGEKRQPPPEAIEACRGLTEGATVQITMPSGETMTATCKTAGSSGTLAALPDRQPPESGSDQSARNPPGERGDAAGGTEAH